MAHAVATGLVALALAHAAPSKPDIVFIVADDLGFNEVGYRNSSRGLMTPSLDDLAFSGVVLENYYVQPICSPTRSALMTGRYPVHLGTQANVIYWDTPWGIDLKERFIPQIAKEAGYATAMFGKWHLGMMSEDYMPTSRGFDVYEGYLQGCGSKYTHVSGCCQAGSATHDQNYTCIAAPAAGAPGPYLGYDWWDATAPRFGVNQGASPEGPGRPGAPRGVFGAAGAPRAPQDPSTWVVNRFGQVLCHGGARILKKPQKVNYRTHLCQ